MRAAEEAAALQRQLEDARSKMAAAAAEAEAAVALSATGAAALQRTSAQQGEKLAALTAEVAAAAERRQRRRWPRLQLGRRRALERQLRWLSSLRLRRAECRKLTR